MLDFTDPESVALHFKLPVLVTDYEVARRILLHYLYDPETCIWHQYRDMHSVLQHMYEFGHKQLICYSLGVDGTTCCAKMTIDPLDTGGAIGWGRSSDIS